MSKKVLVLGGGFSAEREVSIVSAHGVSEALKKSGYQVLEYDLKDVFALLETIKQEQPDVIFNALHGNWGEDGEIQGLLDMLQIPYTHSGVKASAIGMDKDMTKLVCRSCNIRVPNGEKKTVKDFRENGTKLPMPYVLKPVCDGSSVGVFIIRSAEDLKNVNYADENQEILIEEYIKGQELTVCVLKDKALGVTEMRSKTDFYDYKAKYTDGMTTHILPAEIPPEATKTAMENAVKLHQALGCHTMSRSDFRYNQEDGVVLLEINTNPGMTPLSLFPEQYRYNGGSYEELCKIMVEEAQCRKISR